MRNFIIIFNFKVESKILKYPIEEQNSCEILKNKYLKYGNYFENFELTNYGPKSCEFRGTSDRNNLSSHMEITNKMDSIHASKFFNQNPKRATKSILVKNLNVKKIKKNANYDINSNLVHSLFDYANYKAPLSVNNNHSATFCNLTTINSKRNMQKISASINSNIKNKYFMSSSASTSPSHNTSKNRSNLNGKRANYLFRHLPTKLTFGNRLHQSSLESLKKDHKFRANSALNLMHKHIKSVCNTSSSNSSNSNNKNRKFVFCFKSSKSVALGEFDNKQQRKNRFFSVAFDKNNKDNQISSVLSGYNRTEIPATSSMNDFKFKSVAKKCLHLNEFVTLEARIDSKWPGNYNSKNSYNSLFPRYSPEINIISNCNQIYQNSSIDENEVQEIPKVFSSISKSLPMTTYLKSNQNNHSL